MGELEYTLKTTLTAYPRVITAGLAHRGLLLSFALSAGVALSALAGLVYLKPVQAFWLSVLPPVTSLLITVWTTHAHHSGLDTDDPFSASRNILDPIYNRLTGNLGYHTAHHYRCAVHWSELPELHARISERIPDACYYAPGGVLAVLRWFGQTRPEDETLSGAEQDSAVATDRGWMQMGAPYQNPILFRFWFRSPHSSGLGIWLFSKPVRTFGWPMPSRFSPVSVCPRSS